MDELKIIRWGNFDENYKMRSYDVKKDGTKKYSSYSTIKTIKR